MGSFEEYGALAQKLYVEDQQTVVQISEKLNLEIATVKSWKKDYGWDNKRKKFLSSQFSCYSALQELLNYLAKDALEKIKCELLA